MTVPCKSSANVHPRRPDWDRIDTVLLDMDGTLLDKRFDDHFWEEFMPRHWAAVRGMSLDEARRELMERYRAEEGTLRWYDVDFWSEELGLDIMTLKIQFEHLVTVHPHVIEFLERVRRRGHKLYMVTNAHGKTLRFKMERTPLAHHFDGIFMSHDIGYPKEELAFWKKLARAVRFKKSRTLLAEDSLSILRTAEVFGLRWLVHITRPSSSAAPTPAERYHAVTDFGQIMPPA